MFAPIARISNRVGKNLTHIVRQSHSSGGVPGENLPFDTQNIYKFTAIFTVYVASGLGAPYLIVRHQMLKKM